MLGIQPQKQLKYSLRNGWNTAQEKDEISFKKKMKQKSQKWNE